MKIIKFHWIDWFILLIGIIFTGALLRGFLGLVVSLLDIDGQQRVPYVIFSVFFVFLSQAGLFISPWAIRHINGIFKIIVIFAMLPSILLSIFLLVSDSPTILKKGLVSDNLYSIKYISIITMMFIIYVCQIFRLLKSISIEELLKADIQTTKGN